MGDFLREREPDRYDLPRGANLSDVSKQKLVAAVREVQELKNAGGAFSAIVTPQACPKNPYTIIWAFLAIDGDQRSEEGYILLEDLPSSISESHALADRVTTSASAGGGMKVEIQVGR